MTKSIPAIAAAFLMTAIATPVFAQAAIQEPGAYSFYHPNADVLAGRPAYRLRAIERLLQRGCAGTAAAPEVGRAETSTHGAVARASQPASFDEAGCLTDLQERYPADVAWLAGHQR